MQKFMKFHHNNMDIASKSLELQSIGTEPFEFLGIHSAVVKQVLSNEFPAIETKDDKADIVFLLEDDTILHVEFQSTSKKWDILRFCKYHLELYNRHKDIIANKNGVGQIRTIVIYMPNISREKVTDVLNSNQLQFKFEAVFLNEHPGDEHFNTLSRKILENPDVKLSNEELIYLVYNPLMLKENTDTVAARTKKVVEIASKLTDEMIKFKIIGTVTVLAKKFLDAETISGIWEVFEMNGVFQKEMNEMFNEKEKDKEIEKIKKALIAGDLAEAKVLFKYSEHVTSEEFEEIKRSLNS
ncbi:hypothetical protein ACFC4S_21255 [Priestia megaterium]|uniref:hypothetical protein n=1 Tax=Priestia megaterium TaxID=1404 RepID=UPI0035E24C63